MPDDKREIEIFERLIRIETILQNIVDSQGGYVSKEKYDSVEKRVEKLENNQIWLIRGFGAAVIVAIMKSIGQFL